MALWASQEAVSRGEWRISSILTLSTPAWDTGDGEFVPLRAFLQVCFGLPGLFRGSLEAGRWGGPLYGGNVNIVKIARRVIRGLPVWGKISPAIGPQAQKQGIGELALKCLGHFEIERKE